MRIATPILAALLVGCSTVGLLDKESHLGKSLSRWERLLLRSNGLSYTGTHTEELTQIH